MVRKLDRQAAETSSQFGRYLLQYKVNLDKQYRDNVQLSLYASSTGAVLRGCYDLNWWLQYLKLLHCLIEFLQNISKRSLHEFILAAFLQSKTPRKIFCSSNESRCDFPRIFCIFLLNRKVKNFGVKCSSGSQFCYKKKKKKFLDLDCQKSEGMKKKEENQPFDFQR